VNEVRRNRIRRTHEEAAVEVISYLLITLLGVVVLIPFLNVVSKAFSAEWAVISGNVGIFPVGFQLNSMLLVIQSHEFLTAFGNSIFVTFVGTFFILIVTAMTAYPLSKRHLPGMKIILLLFVFTMFFGGGMIPTYLVVKQLHLTNTLQVLIITSLINVFHMLIVKNYYEGLPESIEESAKLDGANNFTILFRIIMPLSIPVYASIAVFTCVMQWNNYFSAMLYINSSALKTLPLYLRDMIAEANDIANLQTRLTDISPEGVIAAAIVASTVPILCVYPFLQKYFIKGMTIGSVKG
jgi:putative aldouronate transport system permease protein